MTNSKLKRLIAAGFIACSVMFPLTETSYAASSVNAEQENGPDALTFKERIDKILAEYDRKHEQAKSRFDNHRIDKVDVVPSLNSSNEQDTITIDASSDTGDVESVDYSISPGVYDFDWQGTPLPQTLYAISKVSNMPVVINGKVEGTVYTSLKGVSYQQALNYLANAFNFNWMEQDGAIIISTSDLMLQNKIFHVNFADKDLLKEEIKSLGIDEKNIYANSEYGTVSVTGTPYQLEAVRRHIAALDHPVKQCLIIAQLIEVNHGKSLDLGMQYTLPTYSHTDNSDDTKSSYSNILDHLVFSVSSQAQKAMSKGNVIARPMVLAKNGQKANIYMGDSVPIMEQTATTSSTNITVTYKDVGTKLEVTPSILQNGEVNLVINTEISNITKWITTGNFSSPQISTRRAETVAHVKSGESMVIGGLMTISELDSLSGIPGLMDLPILGKLFSYHSKSKSYAEVFVMITPYIVTDDIDPAALLRAGTKSAYDEVKNRQGDKSYGK